MALELPNGLADIVAQKMDELSSLRPPLSNDARAARPTNTFLNALKAPPPAGWTNVIVEYPKRSPLVRNLKLDGAIKSIAANYEQFGVRALCIIGDGTFDGHPSHIAIARDASSLPIVYMDFIVDERQLEIARHYGADAVILLAQIVSVRDLKFLVAKAKSYGLDAMVEVSNKSDLKAALDANPPIIAINNRSWSDNAVDLSVTQRLAPQIPSQIEVVSESGFVTPDSVEGVLANSGRKISAVLVSKALMECRTPAALRRLVSAFTRYQAS